MSRRRRPAPVAQLRPTVYVPSGVALPAVEVPGPAPRTGARPARSRPAVAGAVLATLAGALLAPLAASCPAALGAQQPAAPNTPPNAQPPAASAPQTGPDVVRGRVVGDSARPIAGASVTVVRGPDRLTQQATADSAGRFSVRFAEGTGDYLVTVSAPGYRTARRRVQRQGSERVLAADFTLGRDVATLAGVQVRGERPARASNRVAPTTLETGASERWRDGVEGQLAPTVAGDLNALAGATPGVTLGPTGPSILGSGGESNLTTLNGMGLAAGSIPRAARTETRVTGATFDPTRGGFAGANIDVRLGPGDRFFQRRTGFVTLDAPQLQFTDAVGRAAGARNGGVRASVGADGELVRQVITYNVALDVARAVSAPATLVDAADETLLRAGVAPDSVARLLAVAGPLGLSVSGAGIPSDRRRDAVTWLGRLDDTRDTLRTRALTSYAGWTREGALGFGPLAAPSVGGERTQRTLGVQLTAGDFVGPGRRVLTESRLAASRVRTATSPYRALPGATVLVRSPAGTAGAAGGAGDVTGLTLGGGLLATGAQTDWTLEGANETIWNARGRRHRFKALAWARGDGLGQDLVSNPYGQYSFASLEDFAAGRASGYTRTLAQPRRAGTAWNAAAAVAHQWTPSRWFSALYGARLEGSAFGGRPPANGALEQALGVRTGAAPARLHLSPRAGFSFTYNRDRENGSGTNQSPVGRFYRTTAGVVRGGIGEFRDLLRPGILADASAGAGLAGSTTTLSCVGAAVPAADWTRFAADPLAIPSTCAGETGGGALGERAPAVTLIDPRYDVPRSWRASLDWNTNVGKWLLRAGGLGSYDLHQPGVVDANFGGAERFTLPNEGGRPVYVSPAAVDAASGLVAPAEARRSPAFGRVAVRGSDLRGYGGQATVAISPDVFKLRTPGSLYASAAYTLQATRRQYRGFDGAALGDPRVREWAAGPNDARHAVVLQGGFSTQKTGTVTLFARAQSGLPFTPLVQGDVNGDGRGLDRAFVPDPAAADPALGAQLRDLLAGGAPAARACLTSSLGRAAARNGCRGPWTQTLNLQWRPPIPRRWTGRLTSAVYLQNVLGGLDQLFHAGALRGWGTQAAPDPVLLVPRGFDATAAGGPRFRYDVNPRFADTRGRSTLFREPFRVTLDFSVNLAVDFPVQQLRRATEPVRLTAGGWGRRSADSLAAFYLARTSSVHRALLAESDSLFLSAGQVMALRRTDSAFSARVRALYVPLGRFLASRPEGRPGRAELDSVKATEKAYWRVFWEQPEVADSVVTPTQRELFPVLRDMLATPKRDRENSQWQFGNPVPLVDTPRPVASPVTGVRVTNE